MNDNERIKQLEVELMQARAALAACQQDLFNAERNIAAVKRVASCWANVSYAAEVLGALSIEYRP